MDVGWGVDVYTCWRAAAAAAWGRRLEPKRGEEDIREKCGLGQ